MKSKQSELGEEFVSDIRLTTQPSSILDEIEIKYEEIDYHHNSTADAESEDYSHLHPETVSAIPHVDSGSLFVTAKQKSLHDFYLDLLQCERDCGTCLKYMRKLSEHVRATHAPPQPIRDPLLIDRLDDDPDPPCYHLSSLIQVKDEKDEDIEQLECTEEESKSYSVSESDPDFELESESDPDRDPEYSPLTRTLCRQKVIQKMVTSSDQWTPNGTNTLEHKPSTRINIRKKQFIRKSLGEDRDSIHNDRLTAKTHTRERRLNCNNCEKSFSLKSSLVAHMVIHTGERPFKCDMCEKTFRRKSHLTLHNTIHTGERPYKCGECGMGFRAPNHLNAHRSIHTGEKPFKCDICEKRFRSNSNLTIHMTIHTEERPHKCDQCEKSFSQKCKLTLHRRIHVRDNTLREEKKKQQR